MTAALARATLLVSTASTFGALGVLGFLVASIADSPAVATAGLLATSLGVYATGWIAVHLDALVAHATGSVGRRRRPT